MITFVAVCVIVTAIVLRLAYREAKQADADRLAFRRRVNEQEIARAKRKAS